MSLEINFLIIIAQHSSYTATVKVDCTLGGTGGEIISCVTSDRDRIGHYHRI